MKLIRSFSIYTVGTLLASAVPLGLLPVLTRHLSEAEYGVVATMNSLIACLTPLVFWGTAAGVSVEYFKLGEAEFRRYLISSMRIPPLVFIVLSAACWATATSVADRLGVPSVWLAMVPLFVLLSWLPQLLATLLRVQDKAIAFASFELLNAVVGVGLSVLLVVLAELQWQGRMLAIAATSLLGTAIALQWMARQGFLRGHAFDGKALRSAARFGAGLVPHDLGNQALRAADRLVVVGLAGLPAAGQYAVASQVASVMLVLLAAFNRAWAPYVFSQLKDEQPGTREAIVRKSWLVIGGATVFFAVFNAAVPLAYDLFIDARFHASMDSVVWLTLGYLFTAVYMTYIDYIFYVRKTHVLSAITMFNLGCNLLLNWLLVGRYGAVGAAYAFAATMFVVMLLAFVLSNRLHPMPWFYWAKRPT